MFVPSYFIPKAHFGWKAKAFETKKQLIPLKQNKEISSPDFIMSSQPSPDEIKSVAKQIGSSMIRNSRTMHNKAAYGYINLDNIPQFEQREKVVQNLIDEVAKARGLANYRLTIGQREKGARNASTRDLQEKSLKFIKRGKNRSVTGPHREFSGNKVPIFAIWYDKAFSNWPSGVKGPGIQVTDLAHASIEAHSSDSNNQAPLEPVSPDFFMPLFLHYSERPPVANPRNYPDLYNHNPLIDFTRIYKDYCPDQSCRLLILDDFTIGHSVTDSGHEQFLNEGQNQEYRGARTYTVRLK